MPLLHVPLLASALEYPARLNAILVSGHPSPGSFLDSPAMHCYSGPAFVVHSGHESGPRAIQSALCGCRAAGVITVGYTGLSRAGRTREVSLRCGPPFRAATG